MKDLSDRIDLYIPLDKDLYKQIPRANTQELLDSLYIKLSFFAQQRDTKLLILQSYFNAS